MKWSVAYGLELSFVRWKNGNGVGSEAFCLERVDGGLSALSLAQVTLHSIHMQSDELMVRTGRKELQPLLLPNDVLGSLLLLCWGYMRLTYLWIMLCCHLLSYIPSYLHVL